jgi:hypothetical protein
MKAATRIFLIFLSALGGPWASHRPGEHPIRLVIVGESFLPRVPFQLSAEPHSDVTQQADGAAAVGYFDRGNGFSPRLYTLKEIAFVIVALI